MEKSCVSRYSIYRFPDSAMMSTTEDILLLRCTLVHCVSINIMTSVDCIHSLGYDSVYVLELLTERTLTPPFISKLVEMAIPVLITGGTGFVGAFIVDATLSQHPEWAITVLDLRLPEIPKSNVAYETGDVTDLALVTAIVNRLKPKVVIHTAGLVPELAGRYGRKLRNRVWDINVNGTQNMLAAAKDAGVEAFVWTGSCCAVTDDMRYQYPNVDETWPTSSTSLIYGESKASLTLQNTLNGSLLTLLEISGRSRGTRSSCQ